jgi:monomeric sarcosine oxidase
MQQFDVAVVGLGALGSAAAWQASRKGAKVIGFEQFEFGHVKGASHDTSRIVRTSYDAPEYVALAKAAYRDWADLEASAGVSLLTITGGLAFLHKGGTPSAADFTNSLAANDVPYELLTASQVNQRWPQFNVPESFDTVYTADTGLCHAAKTVAAMQSLARSHGAILKERTEVTRIQPQSSGGVIITTPTSQYLARKIILATDAWTNKLLAPLNATIPLTIMQEQVTYYKPSNPSHFTFSPDQHLQSAAGGQQNFPVWLTLGAKNFYGFPTFGEPTIKCARDRSENLVRGNDPAGRTFVHSEELLDELTQFVDGLMPDKGRKVLRTVTCQYAITPEREFVIDDLAKLGYGDVIVALGAGHAFKFAPAIGRVCAELAVEGKTREDVTRWGVRLGAEGQGQGKEVKSKL